MTALTEGNDYRALITVAGELRIAVTALNGAVEALQATVERLERNTAQHVDRRAGDVHGARARR